MRRSRLSSLVASLKISASIRSLRTGTDNLVTSRPRGPQLFSDTRSLAAAHQDFVLDEALKLTDSLLEMLLLAFLDLSLVDEHGFVDRIIEPLRVHGNLECRTVGCLQAHDLGGERWIDRRAVNHSRRDEPLNWLEADVIDQHDADKPHSSRRVQRGPEKSLEEAAA